jgi:hypothetical protein
MNTLQFRAGRIPGSAMLRGSIVLFAASLLGASGASAQEFRGTADQQSACMSDVFRLCSGDIPDVSRIVACLKRERPRLSDGCRAVFGGASTRVASNHRTRRHRHYGSESHQSDRYSPAGYQGYRGYQSYYQSW